MNKEITKLVATAVYSTEGGKYEYDELQKLIEDTSACIEALSGWHSPSEMPELTGWSRCFVELKDGRIVAAAPGMVGTWWDFVTRTEYKTEDVVRWAHMPK